MNKPIVVAIGAGRHQTELIRTLKRMDFFTLAVDMNSDAPGLALADAALVHSAWDAEGIYEKLSEQWKLSDIRAVLTQAARGSIVATARLAEKLHLPHLSVDIAETLNSKIKMSTRFNKQAIHGTPAELLKQGKLLAFPQVLKRENSSGCSGIFVLRTQKEWRAFLTNCEKNETLLSEPLTEGRHLGVIGLAANDTLKIYGIIEQYLKPDLAIDHTVFPAPVNAQIEASLKAYTEKVLRELSFDFGPFQLEVICQPDGSVHFVELEASLLGSYISETMIPMAGSNNLIADTIELATSNRFSENVHPNRLVCVNRYYYAAREGTVAAFRLQNLKPEVQFRPYVACGERVTDTRLYAANAIACAKTISRALDVTADLKVEVEISHAAK